MCFGVCVLVSIFLLVMHWKETTRLNEVVLTVPSDCIISAEPFRTCGCFSGNIEVFGLGDARQMVSVLVILVNQVIKENNNIPVLSV